MPRIRAIKPEYWSSPDTADCRDPWARLLFIAMWNWADDAGRGTANPKELAGFAFPHDEEIDARRVRALLREVSRSFQVALYRVGKRTFYAIPSWSEHQKINNASAARHPAPEEGVPWDPEDPDQEKLPDSPTPPVVLREVSGSPGALEVGSRNKEVGTTSLTAAAARRRDAKAALTDEDFEQFWTAYPRKVDKQAAFRAFKAALKRGATPPQLASAAEAYARERAGQDRTFTKHAATWLNAGSYENAPDPRPLSVAPGGPPSEPDAAYAWLWERGAGEHAARVLRTAYDPRPRPLDDDTPPRDWRLRVGREWIEQHREELLAEFRRGRRISA